VEAARELGLTAYDAAAEDLDARLIADGVGDLDVVLDTVGAPATIEQAARLLRPGGRLVLVGYAVGRDFAFPSARLVLEEIEVIGSRYALRAELERAIRLVAEGRVKMVVDRTLPFEEAEEAFRSLEAGEVVGRLVLEVARNGARPEAGSRGE
jgi:D-arabinose 1-dehydrogenase-like Zn-dependent alcohol dehydrogenase